LISRRLRIEHCPVNTVQGKCLAKALPMPEDAPVTSCAPQLFDAAADRSAFTYVDSNSSDLRL
jgi:hypothetical protein